MWCSESHLSLISYNEFLKITYPAAAADVGAAKGERPKAVSGAAFTLLPLTGPKQTLQFGADSASSWWKRRGRGGGGGGELVTRDLPKGRKKN